MKDLSISMSRCASDVKKPVFRRAIIDLNAVFNNVVRLKSLANVEEFIAVVKADGYGHGAIQVAGAAIAGGATRLGVADVKEALRLIKAGITQVPILAWLHAPDETFHEAVAAGVEIAVSSLQQLDAVAVASTPGDPAAIHVKVETGLGRGGAAPQTWSSLFRRARQLELSGKITVIGLFSHLAGTSMAEDLNQLTLFEEAEQCASDAGLNPALKHLAATAATLSLPATRLNAVRVGVGIYGLSPLDGFTSGDLGLRPAMTLQAAVAATRRVSSGHGVSYGYDYRATQATTLVLIPLGYADGIPRQASGKGAVMINHQTYPVAGRVAMDQLVVDVGNAKVSVGDIATLFGDPAGGAPSADLWAQDAGTINYDIVTTIGSRVNREYSNLRVR